MGMPETDKIIIDLKRDNFSVYSTFIGREAYIWRPLTRFERESAFISSAGDRLLYEDLICNYAVLYPKDIDFSNYHLAGVPSVLAPQIIQETGFDSTDKFSSEIKLRKDNMLNNYVAQLETIIITAFPQYRFDEMRDWNIEQICDMASRAEFAIQKIHGQTGFGIADLNEQAEDEDAEHELTDDELLRQKEQELAEAGLDPIMILGPYYEERKQRPYLEVPFIMGNQFGDEVLLDVIREQLRTRQAVNPKQKQS